MHIGAAVVAPRVVLINDGQQVEVGVQFALQIGDSLFCLRQRVLQLGPGHARDRVHYLVRMVLVLVVVLVVVLAVITATSEASKSTAAAQVLGAAVRRLLQQLQTLQIRVDGVVAGGAADGVDEGRLNVADDHVRLDGQPLDARVVQLIHPPNVVDEVGAQQWVVGVLPAKGQLVADAVRKAGRFGVPEMWAKREENRSGRKKVKGQKEEKKVIAYRSRGSNQCVDLVLWSTKKGFPVSSSVAISQLGGRSMLCSFGPLPEEEEEVLPAGIAGGGGGGGDGRLIIVHNGNKNNTESVQI
ncbi:hypothetical protein TYRP_022447 [Tyrophagus putrescentiae]|nr:hypothetical protein TYRP_022447 [Tyrophagus putrescentiae]